MRVLSRALSGFFSKTKFPGVRTSKRFCDFRKASASLQQRKGTFSKKKQNQMTLNIQH